jgi:hypothetical protein
LRICRRVSSGGGFAGATDEVREARFVITGLCCVSARKWKSVPVTRQSRNPGLPRFAILTNVR